MDYFSLFGLPVDYSIDDSLLTTRYQDLQRQFHPDRHASQPESQRLMALQQTTTINDAYQTLKHPLERARYMLSLQGFDLAVERHSMCDTVFLTEQLMLREELDSIACKPSPEPALSDFARRVVAMTKERTAQMLQELNNQNWLQAADTVRKLYFFDKLHRQIEQLEDRLFDDRS